MIQPLYLPERSLVSKRHVFLNKIAKFFWSCGVIDIEQGIAKQLVCRDYSEVEQHWKDSKISLALRNEVCNIIRVVKDWPNDYYLPSDSMDCLLTTRWSDLEINEFFLEIEKRYGLTWDDIKLSITGQTLESFLCHIYSKKTNSGTPSM